MSIYTLWNKIPYKKRAVITNGVLVKAYMAVFRRAMKPVVIRSLNKGNDKEKSEIAKWLKYNL